MPAAIDLPSDTITLPPPGMREAMARAELGDDVWGEDPTVNALEARAAAMLGKAAGLFVPSGSMGNLLAVLAHCRRGDEVIVGEKSHVYLNEGGAPAVIGGTTLWPLPTAPDGTLDPVLTVAALTWYDAAMSVKVKLEGVEETLLIPLWGRAQETTRPDGLLRDERAVAMVGQLDYDFSKFADDPGTQTGIAVRTEVLDDAARAFFAAHPGAVVLNLAAGLDTRYFRLGENVAHWYEVDLPNVMALRKQLIPEGDRHTFVTGSVLEPAWLDQVQVPEGAPVLVIIEGLLMYLSREEIRTLFRMLAARFPRAEVLLEALGTLGTHNTWIARSVSRTQARFKGGIDDPHELEAIDPGIKVIETWYLLDRHPHRWGFPGLARYVPWFRKQYKIVRLVLWPVAAAGASPSPTEPPPA